MRAWLIKLLAGRRVVFVNADIWSGDRAAGIAPDVRIVMEKGQTFLAIKSTLNSGNLSRAATYINRATTS